MDPMSEEQRFIDMRAVEKVRLTAVAFADAVNEARDEGLTIKPGFYENHGTAFKIQIEAHRTMKFDSVET